MKIIGRHIDSSIVKRFDFGDTWPEIDSTGKIIGIHDGDAIPEHLSMVDWDEKHQRIIIVAGDTGFAAVCDVHA